MNTLIFVLSITTFMNLIAEKCGKIKINDDEGALSLHLIRKPNKFLFALSSLVLIIVSGLRSSIGDTGYYLYAYDNLPESLLQVIGSRDSGFYLFSYVLKLLFEHPQFLIIATTIIILSLILRTLYRYSSIVALSFFLLIVNGTYVSTMNGIRQFIVASILFSLFHLIYEDKKKHYFIFVAIVSTIHFSALIMIPVYFMVRQKPWSRNIYIMIFVSLFTLVLFDNFFGVLSFIIKDTQYSHYLSSINSDVSEGANIYRVLVAAVPVILGWYYREKLYNIEKYYGLYINFSVLNLVFMIFATYNWIFARFSIYFGLYNLLLLPAILKYCFRAKSRILIGYLMVVFYLIYFYFEVNNLIYASYFLNINRDLIGPLTRTVYLN